MTSPTPLAAVASAAAAAALGAVARRRRHVHAVLPELRTPLMWPPLSVGSRVECEVGRRAFLLPTEPVDGVTVTEHAVPGGLTVFVYDPDGRCRPSGALLWIHGGGLVMGAPEVDHLPCSRMARDLGLLVVSVRYRLAPEHPFPAGFDDVVAALRWLRENVADQGVDPTRIAVGGGSAGAGLAAAVAQWATDEGIHLAFQVLLYPMLDDRTVLRADHRGRGRLVWTPRSNRWAWTSYLGRRPTRDDPPPYAVPARRGDLSALPPAWIGVGDLDLFLEEDLDYARRLEAAGVPVQLHVQPGMPHGVDVAASGPTTAAFVGSWFSALGEALAPRD